MKPILRAIVFLRQARDILDQEARHLDKTNNAACEAIEDAVTDIESVLLALENLDGTP